jgi:ketosteroid isomerase-like protein
MSQENVEMIRAGFAAYNRGDVEATLEAYDPAVVFVTLLMGNHHGKQALRRFHEENLKTLSGYRLEPEELIDLGDKVIAVVRMAGAGRVSGIALGDQIALLFTLRDGLVVRQQTLRSREDALEAAGPSE